MRNVAFNGLSFTLLHSEPGIGKRKSIWSVSADEYEMTWVGSETNVIGRFGPEPGKSIDSPYKELVVAGSFAAAGEIFGLGAESVPIFWPITPVFWGVATILTIIGVNTAYAPSK